MIKQFRKLFIAATDLLFYGNFWIAFGALGLYWQTEYIITQQIGIDSMSGFVFASTLALYGLHRIIGIQKVKPFSQQGRYATISQFKNHILFYTGLGFLFTVYFLSQFSTQTIAFLFVPSLLSIAYVVPLFSKKRRLRDFHFIKIFMVAIVWAWVTVLLPIIHTKTPISSNHLLLFTERMLFIFAITLPFDIRDLEIDQHTKVTTIPKKIGISKSIYLSLVCLALMILISSYLFAIHFYTPATYLALLISFLITARLISLSPRYTHDYFYTGALDGMMILQALLVILLRYFIF